MYNRYKGLISAEKLMLFLAESRVRAFLYGRAILIEVKNGTVKTSDNRTLTVLECRASAGDLIEFSSKGTSRGGVVELLCGGHVYRVVIEPLSGRVYLER